MIDILNAIEESINNTYPMRFNNDWIHVGQVEVDNILYGYIVQRGFGLYSRIDKNAKFNENTRINTAYADKEFNVMYQDSRLIVVCT